MQPKKVLGFGHTQGQTRWKSDRVCCCSSSLSVTLWFSKNAIYRRGKFLTMPTKMAMFVEVRSKALSCYESHANLYYEKKAIMQRGSIEYETNNYVSSNRCMKQLMDWLSNPHWTPDTGMPTYLLLSNGTQANGDHSCPVRRRFEEFTSHQLDLRRPTVHTNLALKSERSERVTLGHLSSYMSDASSPDYLRKTRAML